MPIELPRLGSAPNNMANVFAKDMARDFARQEGMTFEEAEYLFKKIGAVAQQRAFAGKPVAFYFLGFFYPRLTEPFMIKGKEHRRLFTHFSISRNVLEQLRKHLPFRGTMKEVYRETKRQWEVENALKRIDLHKVQKVRGKRKPKEEYKGNNYWARHGTNHYSKSKVEEELRNEFERQKEERREKGLIVRRHVIAGSKRKKRGQNRAYNRPREDGEESE